MLRNSQIAAAEATFALPQGPKSGASAAATNPEIKTGKAAARVLQGHPRVASPVLNPIDAAAANQGVPEGHPTDAAAASTVIVEEASHPMPQGQIACASLDDTCGELMRLQRDRIFAIRMQSRCDRAVEAYIRTRIGFTTDPTQMSATDRAKLAKEAKRIKLAVERGEDQSGVADKANEAVASSCSAVILRNMVARESWDDMRSDVEKEMRALAKQLPAWEFVSSVKGVSDLGFAVIVGEAGNLGGYPKKGHLWKRLGLAVIDGKRQGNPGANASAETWITHGYKASRRAEIYAFIDDVMLRSQWRGAKDGVPGHAVGPYGAHYARKKAEYLARYADESTCKGHAENGARRYMAKMFIRDLWKAWRGASGLVSTDHRPIAPRHAA